MIDRLRLFLFDFEYFTENEEGQEEVRQKKNFQYMPSCIDLSRTKSVARKTLDGLSAENKIAIDNHIRKSLKTKINREVKGTILDVAHR